MNFFVIDISIIKLANLESTLPNYNILALNFLGAFCAINQLYCESHYVFIPFFFYTLTLFIIIVQSKWLMPLKLCLDTLTFLQFLLLWFLQ